MNISAVVVTYNRKKLLLECLNALVNQTFKLNKIFIIDNASTDGTENELRNNKYLDLAYIEYKKMKTNLGGSGGFYEGIKLACNQNADWVWIMDDDTIPDLEALEALVIAANKHNMASFFASCVRGIDNQAMNVPSVDLEKAANGYEEWYMYMYDNLIAINRATFVSIMINGKAVKKCGLPCKDFFIWGDDSEYTYRLTSKFDKAYLVGKSWVTHKRANANAIELKIELDYKRISNYHYYFRNKLVTTFYYKGRLKYLIMIFKYIMYSFKVIGSKYGLKKFLVIYKGIIESIGMKKQIAEYIDGQLEE